VVQIELLRKEKEEKFKDIYVKNVTKSFSTNVENLIYQNKYLTNIFGKDRPILI